MDKSFTLPKRVTDKSILFFINCLKQQLENILCCYFYYFNNPIFVENDLFIFVKIIISNLYKNNYIIVKINKQYNSLEDKDVIGNINDFSNISIYKNYCIYKNIKVNVSLTNICNAEKFIILLSKNIPLLNLLLSIKKNLINYANNTSPTTFTRTSKGSYFDETGILKIAEINEPRFDHDPITKKSLGLLIEGVRTNLILNSSILVNQSININTIGNYVFSFYGKGNINLTGVINQNINSNKDFPYRTEILLNISTIGQLNVSINNGVFKYAQLEFGNFSTSWIETNNFIGTRQRDILLISFSNFNDIFLTQGSNPYGTIYCSYSRYYDYNAFPNTSRVWILKRGTTNNNMQLSGITAGPESPGEVLQLRNASGTAQNTPRRTPVPSKNISIRSISTWNVGFQKICFDGFNILSIGNNLPWPSPPNEFQLGGFSQFLGTELYGHVKQLIYWKQNLNDDILQKISAVKI